MRYTNYMIVEGSDAKRTATMVDDMLRAGYELVGGLSVTQANDDCAPVTYLQAMAKPADGPMYDEMCDELRRPGSWAMVPNHSPSDWLNDKWKARPDWQSRVMAEHCQLVERLEKLRAYLKTEGFNLLPLGDRELLDAQEVTMTLYCNILNQRIRRFSEGKG